MKSHVALFAIAVVFGIGAAAQAPMRRYFALRGYDGGSQQNRHRH